MNAQRRVKSEDPEAIPNVSDVRWDDEEGEELLACWCLTPPTSANLTLDGGAILSFHPLHLPCMALDAVSKGR